MAEELIELLRAQGLADAEPVLARQRSTGEDVWTACLELGLLPERSLVRALAKDSGFPGIELGRSIVPVRNLDLVPPEISRGSPVLVIAEVGPELLVAVADPSDQRMVLKLRAATGRQVLPHVVVAGALEKAIEGLREARLEGGSEWRGENAEGQSAPSGYAEVVRPGEQLGSARPAAPSETAPLLETSFEARELPPPPGPKPKLRQKRETIDDTHTRDTLNAGIGIGRVVLVVDDTEAIRKLICTVLAPLGVALVEAADGRRALELARDVQPDIVILDAMIPELHGFEVCRAIKGDPALRRARVLMVSAIYTGWKVGADVRANFGADGFLEKPFRVEELKRLVREMLLPKISQGDAARAREEALALCTQAAAVAKSGGAEAAMSLLEKAAHVDPFSAEPHLYLGQLLRSVQRPYEAVAALERAVELRPDLFRPLAELAVAYETVGFRRTAGEIYSRALAVCQEPVRADLIRHRIEALAVD
jgi:CheY-like chemotaxis protein